jgi:hypothetical protein
MRGGSPEQPLDLPIDPLSAGQFLELSGVIPNVINIDPSHVFSQG